MKGEDFPGAGLRVPVIGEAVDIAGAFVGEK